MIFGEITRHWRARTLASLGLQDSKLYHLLRWSSLLNLVMIGWVFFRAATLRQWYILKHMYVPKHISMADMSYGMGLEQFSVYLAWALILLLIAVDYALVYKPKFILPAWNSRPLRWAAYAVGLYSLVFFGVWERIQFIYFQF